MIAVSMRLPVGLYRKITAIRKRKPHMSMNAIIVEELAREMDKPAQKKVPA